MKRFFLLMLFFSFFISGTAYKSSVFRALDINSENSIIAGGESATGQGIQQWLLASFGLDGSRNLSFGPDNTGVVTSLLNSPAQMGGLKIVSADSSIMIAGTSSGVPTIAHFLADGTLDDSFGTNGLVQLPGSGYCYDLVLDSSSNIIVCGSYITPNQSSFLVQVASITSQGNLNTAFGTNGIVQTNVGITSQANAIIILSDESILVGGTMGGTGNSSCLLINYNTDGSINTSFGNQGITTFTIPKNFPSYIQGLLQATDGTIYASAIIGSKAVILHFNGDGSIDTNFGSGGYVVLGTGYNPSCSTIGFNANSQLIATGNIYDQCFVACMSTGGILNPNFGASGIAYFPLTSGGQAKSAFVNADGEITVAGQVSSLAALGQVSATGSSDSSFGYNGFATLSPLNDSCIRYTKLFEQQANGINGGTFTAGVWATRTLNQFVGDKSSVTLSNSQFTLQPGTYNLSITAPAYNVAGHQIGLYNVTDGIFEAYGSSEYSLSSNSRSVLTHTLFLTAPTTYEVQHYCANTQSDTGFGYAASTASNSEIYTVVSIIQN